MKRPLFFAVLLTLPLLIVAQPKKVAVWETQCADEGISNLKKNMVRADLEAAIDNTPGYFRYDRAMFDVVVAELKFEQSGAVKDEEIMEAGKMAGVQYVVVPQVSMEDNDFYVAVRMIHVESGRAKTETELCSNSAQDIKSACLRLAMRLFDNLGGKPSPPPDSDSHSHEKDYTETAFGVNMRMIYVEGGTFDMGCTGDGSDRTCNDNGSLIRRTTVSSFYIGMLEVTQEQWYAVMGHYDPREEASNSKYHIHYYGEFSLWDEFMRRENDLGDRHYNLLYASAATVDEMGEIIERYPYQFVGEINKVGPKYPMYLVDLEAVESFLDSLSTKTGKKYVLPTEAQWEYAARGGKKGKSTLFAGSDDIETVGWYLGNSDSSVHVCGTLKPNELGIYDMSGNVSEWCRDFFSESYTQYDNNDPTGPAEPDEEDEYHGPPKFVIRGGCWETESCRVIDRSWSLSSLSTSSVGFRVVCIP